MAPKIQRRNADDDDAVPTTGLNEVFNKSADFPELKEINLADILENPHQARKHFHDESIAELSRSIAANGLMQPIMVRRHETERNKYVLIAGERRVRAHRLIPERKTIFAIVSSGKNPEVLSMIENVQRSELTPLDLAEGLKSLLSLKQCTQEDVAGFVGLSLDEVKRILSILRLPSEIIAELRAAYADKIGRSALVELSRIDDASAQRELWERMKTGDVSQGDIRGTRKAVNSAKSSGGPADGHALLAVGKSLKSFAKVVSTLKEHRGVLASEHREQLRKLKEEIETLLG